MTTDGRPHGGPKNIIPPPPVVSGGIHIHITFVTVTRRAGDLEVRSHEGVINDDHDARLLVSDLNDASDVDHLQCRVRRRLDPDHL